MVVKINNKSDFKINEWSESIALEVPFEFIYYIPLNKEKYVASYDGHSYINCVRLADGSLDVIFNNHGLGIGRLKVVRKYFVDDLSFADGVFDVISDDQTDVFLTSGKTFDTYVKTLVVPPYLKGDKGDPMTLETMTEKERGELVKDIAEAIDPEMVMTENEKLRQEAEQGRQTAEQQRSTTFNTLKGEMQSAITAGNAAAGNAQKVVDEYDEKVSEQDSKLSELGLYVDSIMIKNIINLDKITLSGLFATDSPEILSTGSTVYKLDYIPIYKGKSYYVSASNLNIVSGWIQIGITKEIPASNVDIIEVIQYMNANIKDVNLEYNATTDGYLVCFFQNVPGYVFSEIRRDYAIPQLQRSVASLQDEVDEYSEAIFEETEIILENISIDGLFCTADGILNETTNSIYKTDYIPIFKNKKYEIKNERLVYPKNWCVVGTCPTIPTAQTKLAVLLTTDSDTSSIKYRFKSEKDGYLVVLYRIDNQGEKTIIKEIGLSDIPVTTVLRADIERLKKNCNSSNIVIPPAFFAVVGYEFNIYWDTIYNTPDYGAGCPNVMIQAVCAIGSNSQRSYRVTPTTSQEGEYDITIQVFSTDGTLTDEKTSKLIVLNPAQIGVSNPKNVLSLGDSSIDDSGYMIKNLYSNINALGFGDKIKAIGTRGFEGSKHESRSGYAYSTYLSVQKVCRIYVSNLSSIVDNINELNCRPHPEYYNPIDNSRMWISDINLKEGWMTASNNAVPNGWKGELKTFNANIVSVNANVTNVVNDVDNIVLYNNGSVDFNNYMANIYGNPEKTIDILTMANGINDCRGALQTTGMTNNIINNAKAIIDAFLTYNPNGKVLIALPKIKASTLLESHPCSYTLNNYNLRKRIVEFFSNYDERVIVFGEVCGMDRFWGYPIYEKEAAARIPNKIIYSTDAMHPREEGYMQTADTYLGALLYVCKN